MSKKAKTKPEAEPPPQETREEQQERVPAGSEYLRPEEVEPAGEAKWNEATFDDARWP